MAFLEYLNFKLFYREAYREGLETGAWEGINQLDHASIGRN